MDLRIVRVVDGGWMDGLTRDAVTRPDTSTILWETLYEPWDLFTRLDKGGDVTVAEPVTLLRDVCSGHDSSRKNCSIVCTNSDELFESWKTLWHCLSLTSLALANSSFSTLDQHLSGGGNGTPREQISRALTTFGITNATDFDGKSVLNLTYECAAASCRDNNMGKCSIGQLDPGYFERETVQWIKVYEALEPLCDGLESDINIDIAGPGVLITYITQTAMVVFAWLFFLLLKVNKFINTSTSIFTHLFRKTNPGPNLLTHRVSGLERLERTNLAYATSTFLAELHEAQCFFVVAIEIALINASSRSAIFTGADNWQSLLWNRDSVQFLAGMGAWPIILGQISLRRAELDSMYYLLLSTLALVLAGVAADTAANPDPDRIYKMFQGQNVLEECGGHPSLRTFCVEERESIYWYAFPAGSIYAFLGLLAILWWAKLWSLRNSPTSLLRKHKSVSKRQLEAWEWIKWFSIKASLLAIHVAEAGALACICFGLAVIRAPLLNLLLRGETGTWSVGQLVAVLIWAPVISKYAHLAIHSIVWLILLASEMTKGSDFIKVDPAGLDQPRLSVVYNYKIMLKPNAQTQICLPFKEIDNTMGFFDHDTISASNWVKIIALGLVWTPSAYFFNSWVKSQPPGTFVSIACVIFSILSLLISPYLIVLVIFVLLSPLIILAVLYRFMLVLPDLCTGLGPWCVSLFWAQRTPRLCGKCSNVVDQSSILRGTPWRLTRSREEYDFYTKDQLQKSAKDCHLCSLLWHSSFGTQITQAPGAYSVEAITQEPDSTTPLLSGVTRSISSHDCEQDNEAGKILVQISATRKFGQEQLLHIRLYEKGSSAYPWLKIEDASYVSGKHNREQSNMTGSETSFKWARDMVEKCEREHQHCRNHFIRSASQRYLPKRLIDVQAREKGVIQLVLSDQIKSDNIVEYAALSHCWGTTVKSELRKDNEETMKTALIETLDPNFQDAVDIAYKMGSKYLWIDSLCIMQRTKQWEEESGDMGLVYARANLVISATASKNSEGGCYKRKDLFPYDCVLCSNWNSSLVVRSSTKYANLVRLFGEKVDHSFLATRGWTFQERFLASRILHFCSGLMMFECNTLTTSECHREEEYPLNTQFSQNGTLNTPTVPHPGPEPPKRLCTRTIVRRAGPSTRPVTRPGRDMVKKSWYANPEHRIWADQKRRYNAQVSSIRSNAARLSMRGAFSFLWSFRGQSMKEKAEFHMRWYEMVTSYSVRNLTNDSDKMMAIAGVAYFIQQSTGFKYAAGLWEETLPFNLLWAVDSGVKKRPYGRPVPTWSWASVDGKISHRLKKVDPSPTSSSTLRIMAEGNSVSDSWEDIKTLVSDLEVQTTHMVNGMAHSATLKVSCHLRTFSPSSMKYVFDTQEHYKRSEIRCLPVLELVNRKVGMRTRRPQIHGILVRAPSASLGEDTSPVDFSFLLHFPTQSICLTTSHTEAFHSTYRHQTSLDIMATAFYLFPSLPQELKDEIWVFALRSHRRGVQIFRVHNSVSEADNEPQGASRLLDKVNNSWNFGAPPESKYYKNLDGSPNKNVSAYMIDSGLWTACKESRRVIRKHFADPSNNPRGSSGRALVSYCPGSNPFYLSIWPDSDLIIL
ncbi:hypothetical protein FGADI_10122 [Fusarium gaditjirri]|uniref:Heterokaryon incompatibility domain-containing protein n=1 Tax=Fusarium gaditjirri TaxID=282569 RepID=A0A8H4SYC2_9HYPO|nr:hypothetical protein FGADI_10122 [Fusarium gaditjirri]